MYAYHAGLSTIPITHVQCLHKLQCLTACVESQLKVDAVDFDLRLDKGCVDVAEQDCCRLSLVLTLGVTKDPPET